MDPTGWRPPGGGGAVFCGATADVLQGCPSWCEYLCQVTASMQRSACCMSPGTWTHASSDSLAVHLQVSRESQLHHHPATHRCASQEVSGGCHGVHAPPSALAYSPAKALPSRRVQAAKLHGIAAGVKLHTQEARPAAGKPQVAHASTLCLSSLAWATRSKLSLAEQWPLRRSPNTLGLHRGNTQLGWPEWSMFGLSSQPAGSQPAPDATILGN